LALVAVAVAVVVELVVSVVVEVFPVNGAVAGVGVLDCLGLLVVAEIAVAFA
jgi:hypothetical protein